MKNTNDMHPGLRKNPLIFSLLMTLLLLMFPTASGTVITILRLNELQSRFVQGIAFLLAGIIGCTIAKIRYGHRKNMVLSNEMISPLKDYLWFAPLVFVELLPLLFGLKEGLDVPKIIIYFLFTFAVGFAEELYFRGLIAKALERWSLHHAIFISSILFSVGHFLNLLAGATFANTLLQVIFAFIFGIVAVEISFMSGSLSIPILWHTIHNFISLITMANDNKWFIIIEIIQGLVLILYGFFLWTRIMHQERKSL